MGSLVRELQAVLSVYLGIMVEGIVTGLSAVAIPAILRYRQNPPRLMESVLSIIGSRRFTWIRKAQMPRRSYHGTS